MKNSRRALLPLLLFVVGCNVASPDTEVAVQEYVGVWSNEWKGGSIKLEIERGGQRLLFKATEIRTGTVLNMNSAKIEGGYLLVENGGLFAKMAYVKSEDSLVALNNSEPIPGFKRVQPLPN